MGDYWLTGSQMFHVMKNVSESLAGRVGIELVRACLVDLKETKR